MSFDIMFQTVRDGDAKYFDKSLFLEIFQRHAVPGDPPLERVVYPDGGACIYCDADSERLDGITFNHAGGETFFNALVELAQRAEGCVLWPDDPPGLAVFDPELVAFLNPEMVEAIGPAILVRTGAELERLIYDGVIPETADGTG